jgi:hypothetical protein
MTTIQIILLLVIAAITGMGSVLDEGKRIVHLLPVRWLAGYLAI